MIVDVIAARVSAQSIPSVHVVVLNWNGWRNTLACLASLQQQNYPNFQVVVIDNDSSDDSLQELRKAMPSVELVQSGANLGFGGGCNVGIRLALDRGADYVWLINSDATADPGALAALVCVAESDASLSSVGSVLYKSTKPNEIQLWGGGRIALWSGHCMNRHAPGPLDFICGASVLLRCAALIEVGLFDEKTFFMYWEDADLSFRLYKAGWRLAVASDSRVWHKLSGSLGRNHPLLDQYFTQSAVRFLKRYAPMPIISILVMISKMLFKRILLGQVTRFKAVVTGLLQA
jgi:GT2 family glycosyltransferase